LSESLLIPDHPPPIDPADRALLKPLGSLGKSGSAGNVSFLRRTEYITSHRKDDSGGVLRAANRTPGKRAGPPAKLTDAQKNNPETMIRAIEKSFNLAYPADAHKGPDTATRVRGAEITRTERDAWERPRHPTQPGIKLLDSYPVVPDLTGFGDGGRYVLVKYQHNPSKRTAEYDEGLDVALLYPLEQTKKQKRQFDDDMELHRIDPLKHSRPVPQIGYDLYLPDSDATAVKRKISVFDGDRDEDHLYTHHPDMDPNGGIEAPCFRYGHVRSYEPYQQISHEDDPYNDSVAVALHDGETRDQQAAFLYPISQKTFLATDRVKLKLNEYKKEKGVAMDTDLGEEGDPEYSMIDYLDVTVRDMDGDEMQKLVQRARELDPEFGGLS
jgi:hypothetical protein